MARMVHGQWAQDGPSKRQAEHLVVKQDGSRVLYCSGQKFRFAKHNGPLLPEGGNMEEFISKAVTCKRCLAKFERAQN